VFLLVATVLLTGGCAGKKKRARAEAGSMTATDTFESANKSLASRDLRQATATLKRIQFAPQSRQELEPLTRLAMADATYFQGTMLGWIDARNLYTDFVTLNGEHPLAPYAQLQIGQCSLNQVRQPSKDQTLTVQAIRDLETVGRRWPNSPYEYAARSMGREARDNLAESEFMVGKFYLKKKVYPGAISRFRGVVAGFPDYREADKVLFHLAKAYRGDGNQAEARAFLDKLLSTYPNGDYVARAQKLLGSMTVGFEGDVGSSSE
jgi:outer membrane protein assembly factor BamD